jgi:hypothetical protein
MKLYSVVTMVREFQGCKDVELMWFRCEKSDRLHLYGDLIEDYDPTRSKPKEAPSPDDFVDAEARVEELFAEDDARQLKAYFDQNHDDPTTIWEAKLPIQQNTTGFGAVPVGGGCDCLIVYERPAYSLPFKVMAYYDLRHHEKVDGSCLYCGYHLVWDRDGKLRREDTPPPEGRLGHRNQHKRSHAYHRAEKDRTASGTGGSGDNFIPTRGIGSDTLQIEIENAATCALSASAAVEESRGR